MINDSRSDIAQVRVHMPSPCMRMLRLVILGLFAVICALLITTGVTMWKEKGTLNFRTAFAGVPAAETNYHGFCAVPYDFATMDPEMFGLLQDLRSLGDQQNSDELDAQSSMALRQLVASAFLERFDLEQDDDDADDEGFARVTVPTFRDGRSGRFLHDFKYNQSLIVDKTEANCFIMPLDRETVLKPRNMQDLIEKMNEGYYNIDTGVLRKNMRVVTPALEDTSSVAPRIVHECQGMDMYRLERFTGRGRFFCGGRGCFCWCVPENNVLFLLQCSSAASPSCRRAPSMRTSVVATSLSSTLSTIRSSSSMWPIGSNCGGGKQRSVKHIFCV